MSEKLVLWLPTYSGKKIDIEDPDLNEIVIEDIAHALSQQCRYAGHTQRFYSVAEHSVRVANLCSPVNKPSGLMHDAPEAYITDLPRPLKRLPSIAPVYRAIEEIMERAIFTKFNLPLHLPEEVLMFDNEILKVEIPEIYLHPEMASPNCMDDHGKTSVEIGFKDWGWTPIYAEAMFLNMAAELGLADKVYRLSYIPSYSSD